MNRRQFLGLLGTSLGVLSSAAIWLRYRQRIVLLEVESSSGRFVYRDGWIERD